MTTDDTHTPTHADDPATGFAAVTALRALADRLERLHVAKARELGWSWADIAAELDVSRQAVHQRYGGPGA